MRLLWNCLFVALLTVEASIIAHIPLDGTAEAKSDAVAQRINRVLAIHSEKVQSATNLIANEFKEKSNVPEATWFLQIYGNKNLVSSKADAIHLYYNLKRVIQYDKEPLFMSFLRHAAFNRDIPDHFTSVNQVLKFRNSFPETIEFLVKSPAFQTFAKDRRNLDPLVANMVIDSISGNSIWDSVLPNIRSKLFDQWVHIIVTKPNTVVMNWGAGVDATALYSKLRGRNVASAVLLKVLKNSYKTTAEVLGSLKYCGYWDVAHSLVNFFPYRRFISDPGRASELFYAIQADEKSYKGFVQNAAEWNRLQIFADRALWEAKFQSDLSLLASNPRSYLDVIRKFHDQNVLELLQSSKAFEDILKDPFKASRLRYFDLLDPADNIFNRRIIMAASREYSSTAEVLSTLRDLDGDWYTLFYLSKFNSYRKFISDSAHAAEILNAIRHDVDTYKIFLEDAVSIKHLQIFASGETLQTAYQSDLNSLTTKPQSYINVISKFYDDRVLELLGSSRAFDQILNDPFKAHRIKKKIGGFASLGFHIRVFTAATKRYSSTDEVLVTLKDLDSQQIVFDDLAEFWPYSEFISIPRQAEALLRAVQNDPVTYHNFLSNSEELNRLRFAAQRMI